jgi:GNAT superfamily N-acetyltransferase
LKPGKDHVGVGVGAIVVDAGWVLPLKRKQEPERGRWGIQGGIVELDEERTEMEKTSSIRTARREDLGAIVGLLADDELGRQREATDLTPAAPYLRAFHQIDRDPRNELVVVEEEGRVVATLQLTYVPSLTHRGGERAQVEGVRVAASHRGRGTGRLLLRWVVEQARERGCRMVQLTTDKRRPDALRFYESLGFEATHEGMKLKLSVGSDGP